MIYSSVDQLQLKHPEMGVMAEQVNSEEIKKVSDFLNAIAGKESDNNFWKCLEALESSLTPLAWEDFNMADTKFRTEDLLPACGIQETGKVYMIDSGFENCRKMDLNSLNQIIDHVWSAGRDDLIIANESLSWAVYIHHSGGIKYFKS